MARTGLLLVNLGTPAAPRTREVRTYLREFLSDPRVLDMPALGRALLLYGVILPFRPRKSAEAYRKVWTDRGSPVLFHGLDLAAKVQTALGPEIPVLLGGRVRAGYAVGARLFAGLPGPRALVHVLGERPGTMHHAFSIYLTAAAGADWAVPGAIDHPRTRVISGVADTACPPIDAARETAELLADMLRGT